MRTEQTRAGRQLIRLGFVLVAIAVLTAEYVFDRPGVPGALRVLQVALLTGWSAVVHLVLSKRARLEQVPSVATMLGASAMIALLWAADLGVTIASMSGVAYELLLVLFIRDAALSAIALAGNPVCLRISGGLTLAVMLFSSVLVEHRLLYVLTTLYALLGSYWLILLYWSFIQVKLLEGKNHHPPILAIAVWGLLIGAMTVLVVGPRRTLGTLGELLPTSGGTTIADASAQSGVGDGPNLVGGINDPTTSGPVDSDIFLETKETSLYDAMNERYGEPEAPPPNRRSLAVAIEPNEGGLQEERSRQSNPSREFSVARGTPERRRATPDRSAGEAYSVRGKLPLHLRLVAYDEFDGISWKEPTIGAESIELQLGFAGWIEVPRPGRSIDAGSVRHEVVVGTMDAPQLPLPIRCDRFRIDRVDRPGFFAQAQEGILRYRADALPRQTKIETRTPTIDPVRLRALNFPSGSSYALPKYLRTKVDPDPEDGSGPRELDPRISDLARQWTEGIDRGWPQVEAIADRLRSEYERDEGAVISAEVGDPIAHFLFDRRRGDDYAFATAACMLLRSLEYPSRFVQGLYVDPRRHDPDSGWTPVFWPADLHTWVEVQLPGGEWVVVEATPGYEVMGPAPALLARIGAAVAAVGRWVGRHPAIVAGLLVLIGATLGLRAWLADRFVTLLWWLSFRGEARQCVMATTRLLERRASLSGRRRPRSVTLRHWYGAAADDLADEPARSALARLIRLSEWACYAPDSAGSPRTQEDAAIRTQCREAARLCTRTALRQSVAPPEDLGARAPMRRVSLTGAALVALAIGLFPRAGLADTGDLPDLPPFPEIFAGMDAAEADGFDEPGNDRDFEPPSAASLRALGIEPLEDPSLADRQSLAILQAITALWFFLVGASVGSFLNVVVYRMPRRLPVWGRRSHCPSCQASLSFRENMPIVGWLRVRGRCRYCGAPISPRYPIVEALAGAIFLGLLYVQLLSGGGSVPVREPNSYAGVVWILWYPKWDLITLYLYHLFLLCTLLCVSLIVLDRQRVPGRLVLVAIAVGYLGPVLAAHLHPVPLRFPRPDWLPRSGVSPLEAVNGLAGHLAGVLLGAVLGLSTERRSGLIVVLGLAGLYLGWQAAFSVALLAAIALPLTTTASRILAPSRRALPPAIPASIAVLAQVVGWRWLSDRPFWPSHSSTPVEMAGALAIVACLAFTHRRLESWRSFADPSGELASSPPEEFPQAEEPSPAESPDTRE